MLNEITETLPERILVFIPTYRCAPQIVRVLEQFRDFSIHNLFTEILVLDNNSPDNTVRSAMDKAESLALGKISIARNLDNYGLGGSHKSAFNYAICNNYSHVLVLHGDDQGDIRDIIPLMVQGEYQNFDCCLGARFHPDSILKGYSRIRIIGNMVYNLLFSIVSGRKLYDLGSGLNIYRTSTLKSGYWHKFQDNLMFNYYMILAHVTRNDRILFFPISWREEDQISNVKLMSQALKTLAILLHYILNRPKFISGEFRAVMHDSYNFEFLANRL